MALLPRLPPKEAETVALRTEVAACCGGRLHRRVESQPTERRLVRCRCETGGTVGCAATAGRPLLSPRPCSG